MARREGLYEVDGELVSERTPPVRWRAPCRSCQGRCVELNTFAGIGLALTLEVEVPELRAMLRVLQCVAPGGSALQCRFDDAFDRLTLTSRPGFLRARRVIKAGV